MNRVPHLPGYGITELLYAGSRTLVYRGVRECDDCPVALKLLRNPFPSFHELVQFRNQYAIAKSINLTSIVKMLALIPYGNAYALVMEDFGGISLKELLKQEGNLGKSPQTLTAFLQIAIQIAEALDSLYRHRVIHKDLKPANILIHPDTKQVKLIDFSIASLLPKETQEIQNANTLEGTLAYISPEQTGRMNRGIDYRSDFYSLGVTFYQLLTGQLPFVSDDPMELVHYHLAKQPTPLEQCQMQNSNSTIEIPKIISDLVMKLMAKNAEERYQSALGIKYDLEICLHQLQKTGKIEAFELGQRDVCDRFIIPEKLYGRDTEVKTLLDTFERVAGGNSELMLVAGFSGIGKTAVVNEVHKPIVRQRGYFIKGKFDQFNRNIPLSAFVQALRDLMGQLLSESDAQLAQWKAKIRAAVGDNGKVLIDVIPELEQIIGKQPPAPELSGSAAQNRFNLLFQNFIEVFTTVEHPLVVFLDDLQWADLASLTLIKLLMNDNGYLLMLGAYRDNEVSPAHPLILTVEELKKTKAISLRERCANVNTITLAPLAFDDTNHLVADTLNCSRKLAQPLTELIERKTQGNPFFTTQFLKALYEDGYIRFDLDYRYWKCDITQVKALSVTDDVVEFMALQLQKLPTETQQVLKLAACVGNQFDLATLAIVSERSPTDAAIALWKALQEGLVLPTSQVYKFFQDIEQADIENAANPTYRFLHDRVQQAAYSLIPESERAIAHYQIGQLLLQQISPEAREERIFQLVNQLNYGTTLIVEQTEQDDLAQLNLTACRKARGATAYQAAREYAKVGLQLLGTDPWQRCYEMTLSLHELAVEVASLVGDFEQMNQWIDAAINHAKTPLDRVQIYQVKIQSLTSRNEFLEAIATGQSVLQLLGINLPDSATIEDVRQIKQEIDALMSDRPIEGLIHQPKMTDAQQLAIMQIAAGITPACYMTGSMLYFLIVALQVKLSIQYGNSPVSAYSYAGYAFQLRTLWQEMTGVQSFGQLAYHLASEPEVKNVRPTTFLLLGGFVLHWTNPLPETLPILQEGYQAGLETGNLDVGYDAQFFCLNSYWCGQLLTELEPQLRAYYQQLCNLNQVTTANCCLIYWQATLILLGNSENEIYLRQESYEEKILFEAKAANDFFRLCQFYLYRFTLSFLFQDISQAEKDAEQTRQYLAGCMGSIIEPTLYFYDSLTVLSNLWKSNAESDERWQRMQENQAKLEKWADHAPINHLHKYHLVEAEKYRVLNQKTTALELYDLAIKGAKENEYIHEEALANELAAKFYLDWGKEKVAAGYMQEAYYCYGRWGALAKVQDLERRYPNLLAPILQQQKMSLSATETVFPTKSLTAFHAAATQSSTSSSTSISATLDLATVLKASQTLSREIQLDKLLATLLHTVLENAGADKGALLMPRQNQWFVEAVATIGETARVESISLSNHQEISHTLINTVKRSLQPVVIVDAAADLVLATDAYVVQQKPKSMLCTPILQQGKLVAILYLENRVTTGVFTRDRIQLLNFLCTQAAISLENARLYQQAQTYAQQLEQSQLQIVQSEKMASLGNLVAGVAHEINNPIGFLNGSINNAKDYVQDLLAHLQLYQQHYPNPAAPIQDHAADIDLEFLSEDLPKLLDSMTGASDRITNISNSLRTFSRADTDRKVSANLHEGIDSTLLILKYRLKANEYRPAIAVIKEYGELPLVSCFPGQLNQVFMNILANAIDMFDDIAQNQSFDQIKANPQQITIQTEIISERVKIAIRDNGTGMTEAVKAKIFDHLFTTKAVGKGTGLGLAIARQIVEDKHGGAIAVRSHLGEGTEFEIVLPLR